MPYGATFDPCHCAIDVVTSTLEWTPSIGQAGTYYITFYVGETCYTSIGYFTIAVVVHPYDLDPVETYEIYVGQEWHLKLTAYWVPPQPSRLICLWVDVTTLPESATFTDCHCDYGSVTSHLYWTPTLDQIGEYIIVPLVGDTCGYYNFPYPIKVIVNELDYEPPIVEIYGPLSGYEIAEEEVTITGVITDNMGVVSIGSIHEWEGGEEATSGTIDPAQTYYPFEWNFTLYEGWNKVTIFTDDIGGNYGEDSTVLYNTKSFSDPNDTEQSLFDTKMGRYNNDGKGVIDGNSDLPSVQDTVNSLGQNGKGKYITIKEKVCENGAVKKCVLKVRTKFVHWNQGDDKSRSRIGGFCDIAGAVPTIEKDQNEKIKVIKVDFVIMIHAGKGEKAEKTKVGRVDDDKLLYHEMLHVQLALDEWKKDGWDGWDLCCKCKKLKEFNVGDGDHSTIPGLEQKYLKDLAEARGIEITYHDIKASTSEEGKFEVEIPKPEKEGGAEQLDTWGFGFKDMKTYLYKDKIVVKGNLSDKTKDAHITVWWDPPDVGVIAYIDILAEGFPPSKPSTLSGPSSGKVGKTYTYSTSATDPDGDQIQYGWDWNGDDVVDEWTGFHASGETISTSHTWTEEFTGEIKVKAKDIYGLESEWSEPLPISMPKNKNIMITNQRLINIIQKLFPSINLHKLGLTH